MKLDLLARASLTADGGSSWRFTKDTLLNVHSATLPHIYPGKCLGSDGLLHISCQRTDVLRSCITVESFSQLLSSITHVLGRSHHLSSPLPFCTDKFTGNDQLGHDQDLRTLRDADRRCSFSCRAPKAQYKSYFHFHFNDEAVVR